MKSEKELACRRFIGVLRYHTCGRVFGTLDNRDDSDDFQLKQTTSTSGPCFVARWSSIRRARKPTGVRLHLPEQWSYVCGQKTVRLLRNGHGTFGCTRRSANQPLSVPICVNSLADTLNSQSVLIEWSSSSVFLSCCISSSIQRENRHRLEGWATSKTSIQPTQCHCTVFKTGGGGM